MFFAMSLCLSDHKVLLVTDMLLFGCSGFKYRFIKLDLVTEGKFDSVDVNPAKASVCKTLRHRNLPYSDHLKGFFHFYM